MYSLTKEETIKLIQDVADIKTAVIGNSTFKQKGLAERMDEMEKWKNGMMLKISAILGGCAVVMFLIDKFGDKIFTKI